MEIKFKETSRKELKKIDKSFQKRIVKKISSLSTDPLVGKKLQGKFEGTRSIKVWPFRIIYEIKENNILIHKIQHRQGIYK